MKKLLFAGLLLFSVVSFGQTTMQEYNYLTKGYVLQVETGQNLNKGYSVKLIGNFSVSFINEAKKEAKRITDFFSVYNAASAMSTEPIGIMIKYYRSDVKKDTYFFMPNKYASNEVMNKAFEDYTKVFANNEVAQQHSWNYLRMLTALNVK